MAIELSPKQIVSELDKYIIGQDEAKKAVAIALRNRYRRSKLSPEMREEIKQGVMYYCGISCGKILLFDSFRATISYRKTVNPMGECNAPSYLCRRNKRC